MSPNQMFIKSGEIVVDPPDNPPGTYLRYLMTIGNNESYIYVNTDDLVEREQAIRRCLSGAIWRTPSIITDDLIDDANDVSVDVSDYL